MEILSVFHLKGGVGKSSLTYNLADELEKLNKRVLVVDLDPQGSLSLCFDLYNPDLATLHEVFQNQATIQSLIQRVSPRLHVIPSHLGLSQCERWLAQAFKRELKLSRTLDPIIRDYDVIVFDAAPALSFLNINMLHTIGKMIVPVVPDFLGVHSLKVLMENIEQLQNEGIMNEVTIKILPNMVDRRSSLTIESLEALSSFYPNELLDISIPVSQYLKESGVSHRALSAIKRAQHVREPIALLARSIVRNFRTSKKEKYSHELTI